MGSPFICRGSFGSRPDPPHIPYPPLSLSFEPTRNFEFLGWLVWCVGECIVFKGERVGSGLIFIYNIAFNGIPAAYLTVIS